MNSECYNIGVFGNVHAEIESNDEEVFIKQLMAWTNEQEVNLDPIY
jgi:hypothetical protein